MKFEDDFLIDKFNLDEEWIRLPQKYLEWSEEYANAVYKRDLLKLKLQMLQAELDSKIRKNPKKYGLTKPTETAIANVIQQDKEYQKLFLKYLKASRKANILSSIKEALSQKKKALEALTQLWLTNYYAEELSEEVKQKIREKVSEEIKDKLVIES